MQPRRYRVVTRPDVREALRAAPPEVKQDLADILSAIESGPFPGDSSLVILEYKDAPAGFSVARGRLLVAYQVMADHPIIKIFYATWA